VRISLRGARLFGGIGATIALAAAIFGLVTINRALDLSHLQRLERRNAILAEELDRAHGIIDQIGDTIAALARRDELVRLLAGLEPTDPAVQLAGIGGPAGTWTPREQILSEAPEGRSALTLREEVDNYLRRANLLAGSFIEAAESLEVHTDRLARTPSISPIDPSVSWYTSPFAAERMHPIYHEMRPHDGIDVSAPMGTPILAPANGRVIDVRTIAGYGKTVTVDHGFGVHTFFAHCSKTLVHVGQMVKRGERIAEVGSTGIATGPHLHYEVLVNGRPVNPKGYIFPEKIVD
jgi:murein DD-endopeptidase MepM/ murein hydrolase activator NlpD